MKKMRALPLTLTLLLASLFAWTSARAATAPPEIASFSKPAAGSLELIFRGSGSPFLVQKRDSLDAAAVWVDVPEAVVTELQPGVYMALVPSWNAQAGLGFFRVVGEGNAEIPAWTVLLRVSSPANGTHFVQGESPVVTVTILDTKAQGFTRDSFSTLNLYMYGPEDPKTAVTPVKLMNATADRTKTPHHYISLKSSPGVQASGNVLTYQLQSITDEAPGTYTVGLNTVLAADGAQQMLKLAKIQIGTATVETPTVAKVQCASCHEGSANDKMYLHHADPGRSPFGSFSLDSDPVTSCKICHNNEGYAAFRNAEGGRTPDHIVIRVHGVHMGEELKLPFNTNSVTGNFRHYTHLLFPKDIRNCTSCHVDDKWKTAPSRLACGTCHDNTWFGPEPVPEGWSEHAGGSQSTDKNCAMCHPANEIAGLDFDSIPDSHEIPPPNMDEVDITLTPPANGQFYVAGEKPVVTLVFKDDAGNPIDHTKVTDANFSTASLFVYGPRNHAKPVLTSLAKNGTSKLRASVSSSKAGPWPINGKIFKIAVNGSAPQEIVISGATDLVTAAEVVASLNAVITNLNAKATVSGANVNMRTTIQGAQARFEIYNGEVTTAMGWKRAPNTVMEPDVTVPAITIPNNDLRDLSDPLDYEDPMVTRTTANITYQLDDVAGLTPGTYFVHSYHLPRAGRIPGLAAPTGLGLAQFQVGTVTPEKKIATNCSDCHGDTIMHLYAGPIHAAPFDTDWCLACHDYGRNGTGEMFKNQGGTSLAGWSGYGAMPIGRRVHGVHSGEYLDYPEEIYANATKDTFGHIIFPQDLRNCTKCHAESASWTQNPSRMACLACHDSDEAKTHGLLNTYIGDPSDPYGPKAVETCFICHGEGAEFSADRVHKIANPYVPPYPREKE